ncbi:GpE family phage tail protein [Burkholderia plantarii]|nr:GpE family phage tail protein [Burkholderia plantarii]WLE59287.1 GpE family phage tail protein [Burkholderia plantarii]
MADIALVFGWTPAAMADMDLSELARWRERARVRYERNE